MRSRRMSGGTLVQWIQGCSISPEDLRVVLATVVGDFESVSVWRGEEPAFLLLARTARTRWAASGGRHPGLASPLPAVLNC